MTRNVITVEGHVLTIEEVAGKQTITKAALNPENNTLTIPDSEGVESIGDSVFRDCTSLAVITLPKGLRSIDDCAFFRCTSLTAITFPDGLQRIEDCVFYSCSSLTAIALPEGLRSMGAYAFSGCTSLTVIILPKELQRIGCSAFSGCTSLADIILPEGLQSIENCMFNGCTSLTGITLSEGLRSIDACAFYRCTSLQQVAMPLYGAVEVHGDSFTTAGLQIIQPELSLPLAFNDFYEVKGSYYKKPFDLLPRLAKASYRYYFFMLCITERFKRVADAVSEQVEAGREQAQGVVIVSELRVNSIVASLLPVEIWKYILTFVSDIIAGRAVTDIADIDPYFWQQKERTAVVNDWFVLWDNAVGPNAGDAATPASINLKAVREDSSAEKRTDKRLRCTIM